MIRKIPGDQENVAMLRAALRGKASHVWESEDALTSLVIGVLELKEQHRFLIQFLNDALPLRGSKDDRLPSGSIVEKVEFWPKLRKSRVEPDVRIDVFLPLGVHHSIFIEAKHRSGMSGEGNQLVREWKAIEDEGIRDFSLIYLTGDYTCPRRDIDDARQQIGPDAEVRLRWLSWRSLTRHLRNTESELLQQLRQAMIRKDLSYFEGWPEVAAVGSTTWHFTLPKLCFIWANENLQATVWGFRPPIDPTQSGERS